MSFRARVPKQLALLALPTWMETILSLFVFASQIAYLGRSDSLLSEDGKAHLYRSTRLEVDGLLAISLQRIGIE